MKVMSPRVVSVNVGRVLDAPWAGRPRRTAIDKRPVEGPVRVLELGLEGDEIGDPRHHGGIHQAVYAFAGEDLAHWGGLLGRPLRHGLFGENLTTAGIDLNQAVLGERWRIGTALVSPVDVRTPCNTFRAWLAREGLDAEAWVKRFAASGRPGAYLRVLEEGVVRAGDPIVVEHRPDHGVTVETMFAAVISDPSRIPELLVVEGLADKVYAAAQRQLGGWPTVR
jgi:MOSC domain-containing protein YiiM